LKTSTGLLILIVIMHFITLSNITLFDGRWNGIAIGSLSKMNDWYRNEKTYNYV
jgi:hypothetical protein